VGISLLAGSLKVKRVIDLAMTEKYKVVFLSDLPVLPIIRNFANGHRAWQRASDCECWGQTQVGMR
jgi:hypothetical protein